MDAWKFQLNVLQVVPRLTEEASGPSYSVRRLTESLRDVGVNTDLVSLDRFPSTESFVPFFNRYVYGKMGVSSSMKRYFETLKREDYDLIHVHGIWMHPSIYAALAAKKLRIPLVFSPRGSFSEWAMASGSIFKQIYWFYWKHLLSGVSAFHATAESEGQDIQRLFPGIRIFNVPNGIDIPQIQAVTPRAGLSGLVNSNGKRVIFISRIHPKKNIKGLVAAWSQMKFGSDGHVLDIYGTGEPKHEREIKNYIECINDPSICLHGPVFGEHKFQLYHDADVFILPSFSENFGLVVAEALACGTPVITTDGTPWHALVEKRCGWYCTPTASDLGACLRLALLSSSDELSQMGRSGQMWVRNDFNWQRLASEMKRQYGQTIKENKINID